MTINGVPVRFFECEADWHEKCFYGIIQCSLQGLANPADFYGKILDKCRCGSYSKCLKSNRKGDLRQETKRQRDI